MVTKDYELTGMTCTNCAKTITKKVKSIPGVKKVKVSLALNYMKLEKDDNVTDQDIIKSVKSVGYGAKVSDEFKFDTKMTKEMKILLIRFSVSLILTIPLLIGMIMMLSKFDNPATYALTNPIFQLIVASIIEFIIGYKFFVEVYGGIKTLRTNMSFLVVLGTLSGYGLSIYNSIQNNWTSTLESKHLFYEAIAVIITLVLLGKILETYAKSNTSNSLKKISELIPNKTIIIKNGIEKEINSVDLKINDLVVLKTGDKVPTDGILLKGSLYTNEMMISGESNSVLKNIKDNLTGGTIVEDGYGVLKVTKTLSENTISKIINLVSDAQSDEINISKLADKISTWFVPIVVLIAIITMVSYIGIDHYFSERSIVNPISVIVIACPCALGLASPTAIMVGTGKAAENGIIFKNGNHLENLSKLNTIVFDKTGTLTTGKMEIDSIDLISKKYKLSEIKTYLKSLESLSNHPIAKAIVSSLKNSKKVELSYFENIKSKGLIGKYNDLEIKVGSPKWLAKDKKILNNISLKQKEGKVSLLISINNETVASIHLSDQIKDESYKLISLIQNMSINVVMLTGDSSNTANYVANKLGINQVYSEIPIDKKAFIISKLQQDGNIVAMVGDGINDAVALTKANIGITLNDSVDVAIESSDVILTRNKLVDIYNAILIAKKTYKKIKTNLFWAFIYNIIVIPIAAAGLLMPEFSALAMALSSISVVVNSLLLKIKIKK